AFAEHYPKVWWIGSVGVGTNNRLNFDKNGYSTSIALSFPVFDGFRIQGEADRQEAIAMEREQDLRNANLVVKDLNARFDEVIQSAHAQLRTLYDERKLGMDALKMAKERYTNFLGSMADIREGIRNMIRIETSINDSKAD